MKNWISKHKIKKMQRGGTIPEITVYGKDQYKEKLRENNAQYFSDMDKYKKDSTNWIKSNKAYRDSLFLHKGANRQWDGEIDKLLDYDNKSYSELFKSPFLNEGEKKETLDYVNLGRARYKKLSDYTSSYSMPNKNMLERRDTNDGYNVIAGGYPTNYPDVLDNFTSEQIIKGNPIKPVGIASTSQGGAHGLYKEPNKKFIPKKPIKGTSASHVNYDPTYEKIKMRSLWANQAKADTTAKIGTLNPSDFNDPSKGFTINEAAKFPSEIKNKWNIDHILSQINGLNK